MSQKPFIYTCLNCHKNLYSQAEKATHKCEEIVKEGEVRRIKNQLKIKNDEKIVLESRLIELENQEYNLLSEEEKERLDKIETEKKESEAKKKLDAGNALKETHQKELKEKLKELEKEIVNCKKENSELVSKLEAKNKEVNSLKVEIKTVTANFDKEEQKHKNAKSANKSEKKEVKVN